MREESVYPLLLVLLLSGNRVYRLCLSFQRFSMCRRAPTHTCVCFKNYKWTYAKQCSVSYLLYHVMCLGHSPVSLYIDTQYVYISQSKCSLLTDIWLIFWLLLWLQCCHKYLCTFIFAYIREYICRVNS